MATKFHRINVNFTDEAYAKLTAFAAQTNRGISDVMRDSLALATWFDKIEQEGGRVLVERDGKIVEAIWV